jgi:hypothetical protein
MRNYVYACAMGFIFLVVSAAAKSDRYVKDNEFHSSSPKLQVRVDPKFNYLGKLDYTLQQQSPDRLHSISYETKSYVFVNGVDNQLKKAVYVQIRREQTKYVGNLLGDAKANLRTGICTLGEKDYKCFTRVIFLSMDDPLTKFFTEQGYSLPGCVMARTYSRADIGLGTYLVVITYLENFSDSGLSCESWGVENGLTQTHQQYVELFDRNCKASFKVVAKWPERPGIKGLLEGES